MSDLACLSSHAINCLDEILFDVVVKVNDVGCRTPEVDTAGVLVMTDILVADIARVLKAFKVLSSVIDFNIVDVEETSRFPRKCACDVQA